MGASRFCKGAWEVGERALGWGLTREKEQGKQCDRVCRGSGESGVGKASWPSAAGRGGVRRGCAAPQARMPKLHAPYGSTTHAATTLAMV